MANRRQPIIKQVSTFDLPELRKAFDRGGRFASAEFIKKSTGKNRIINGKTLVHRGLVGGEASYDAESKGQLRIFDVNAKDKNGVRVGGYRAVTAKNVLWVQADGVKYVVKDNVIPELVFVQSITHSLATSILRLVLSGSVYLFYNVPRSLYLNFVDAENKGRFFNDHVKGLYEYEKIS